MLALARKQGPLPVFRFFLICCNTFGIVSLVLRVATIGWNDRSLPMDQTESTTWIVDNQTHLIEITSIPQPSPKDDTFGSSVSSGTGQIQYPILFMASMMCIILYLVGLIGAYKKQYGMLLSYAIVMFILSVFNVVMSGFNIFLWILHITMAMVAFFMCVTLRREENQAYEDNL